MNFPPSFCKLQYEYLLFITLLLVKIHAPRGNELVDFLVKLWELDKPHGKWEKEQFCDLPLWNGLLKAVQESYALRRKQASTLHQRRLWNKILVEIEIAQRLSVAYGYPRRAYIEITKDCNLRCPMCPQGYEDLNRDSLPITAISHLEKIIPYFELVELFGFGEPLTCKYFSEWIHQWPCIENQIVTTTTNGILLNKSIIENILTSSLNQIRFSLDAVSPETYKIMRGIDGFNRVIKNIRYLVQERNKRKISLEIWIRLVATRQNIHELPSFVQLGCDLGIDLVEVMMLQAFTPDMWKQSLVYDRTLCNQMFEKAEKSARKLGMRFHHPEYFDLSLTRAQMDKGELLNSCREPWEYIYMTNEQTVRACCQNMTQVGDFQKNNFNEIWNGKEYRYFRHQLSSNHQQYRCRFCFLNFLYADVNNIRTHLIDIKPHYDELGLNGHIHRPDTPDLETVIANFLKSNGN